MSDNLPGAKTRIVYPTNYDPSYTIFDAIKVVSQPEIVGIVDDPRLSEEANLLARAFFANLTATLEEIEEVGIDQIDGDKLPYSDLSAYMDNFFDAHPDKCVESNLTTEN